MIGRGADIVSQDSVPAGSSRTARSPSLSDSLRDSAADRSLASPPSGADAVAEDEAAALSREAPGAGCNDEKEDMTRATAILAHTTSPYYGRESRRLGRHARRIAGSVLGATLEASGKDACWSDFDLVIAVEEPMDEGFDWSSQSTTATVLSST